MTKKSEYPRKPKAKGEPVKSYRDYLRENANKPEYKNMSILQDSLVKNLLDEKNT